MTLLYLLVVNVPQRFHQDHSFTLWRPGSDLTSLQTTWAARRESQELHSTLDKKQQQTVQQSCPPEAWQIRGGNKKSYWRIHGKGWSDKVRARCKIFFRFFVQIQFYLLQKNVTKIKCTKWLSIDLAVHKERKKEMSSVFLHCYNSESKGCNLGFKLVSNRLPQVSPHHHSRSSKHKTNHTSVHITFWKAAKEHSKISGHSKGMILQDAQPITLTIGLFHLLFRSDR